MRTTDNLSLHSLIHYLIYIYNTISRSIGRGIYGGLGNEYRFQRFIYISPKLILENLSSCSTLSHSSTVILSHLIKISETCISHSPLPDEVEVDGVEIGKMTDTISNALEAYIGDLITPSKEV